MLYGIKMLKGQDYIGSREKRNFDLLFSSLTLPLVSPFIGVVGLQSVLLGGGITERYVKIMPDGAEEVFKKIAKHDNPLGRTACKLGIDDLVQLAGVVSGKYTLVGVRAMDAITHERYETADRCVYDDWIQVQLETGSLPGIFGKRQQAVHSTGLTTTAEIREAMRWDIDYLTKDASMAHDLSILLQSPFDLVTALKNDIHV